MEVKSNYGGTKSSSETQSLIHQIQQEFKLILFKVFYLILKDEEQSLLVAISLQLIVYFQFCAFLFQRKIYYIWGENTISYNLNQFFGYFLFSTYFNESDFQSFIAIMYALLGLIIFSIIILLLIGFASEQNKNQSFSWPIIILKFLFILFTTILYRPILNTFFELLNCEQINGVYRLSLFTEECWSSNHIIHGIVAIFGIVIFYIMVLIIDLLYFEAKYDVKILIAKKSGRTKVLMYFYFLVLEICFVVIDISNYDYVIVLIIFIGAFINFWRLHKFQDYFHPISQKIASILGTLIMWNAFLMLFALYLEGTIFHGIIYAWIIGIPFISLAVFQKEEYNYDLLLMNYLKNDDPNDIVNLTTYITKLSNNYHINKHFNIMLDALIEVHKTTCPKDDCVLKIKKLINKQFIKLKNENNSPRDIQIQLLLGEIYMGFIKKHSNQISLRINYAFYLYDNLKQKQLALSEFTQIEKLYPNIDNEFIIYRYKRIIEEELNIQQNETYAINSEITSELNLQNNMKQLQNKIERATLMHMDFWSQLQEDFPDLGKMNDIGNKINISIQQVDELWNKIQKISQNQPKPMRLYGKFILEVLQDKDYGEELLDKAKEIQIQNNKMKNKQQIAIFSDEDVSYEPLPSMIVSTSQEKYTQITNVNLSLCNLIGYQKSELLNRKINMLIPSTFAKFHENQIDNFLQSNDPSKLNKEKFVYVKHKSGYIIPTYLFLKTIQTLDDNIQLVAQFRMVKSFKVACYLILDNDEIIESITSSCMCNLFIDYKMINHRKIRFNELFPQYDKNLYISKTSCQISLDLTTPLIQNSTYLQYYINELDESNLIQFQIQVIEIENEHHDQVGGYVIKLEKLQGDLSQILPKEIEQLGIPIQTINSFQFKYFAGKALFVGENTDDVYSARVDQSVVWEQQSSRVTEESQPEKIKTTEEVIIPRINYADGIRTLRLFDNRIQDIDDIKLSYSEGEEDQKSQSIFQKIPNQNEEIENIQNINIFRNRKIMNQVINNIKTPISVTILSWTLNIIIIFVTTLSFTSYFISNSQFNRISSILQLIEYAGSRNSEINQIGMNIQNMEMLQLGIWNLDEDESETYFLDQKNQLNNSITTLSTVNKEIMLSDIYINAQIEELHTQDVVKIRIADENFQYYDIFQATQQIISKSLIVRDKNKNQINGNDEDLNFLRYNIQNQVVFAFVNETNYYHIGLINNLNDNNDFFLSLIIASACILFIGIIIIILQLIRIAVIQEQILQLFIDIPEKTVKYLYNKSENFISNIQIGEEEEISSEFSDDDQQQNQNKELNRTLKSKRKRKMFKNTDQFHRTQIIIALFVICLFQAYFILTYFLNEIINNNTSQQVQELNVTTRLQSYYRFVDNAEHSLFLHRSDPILQIDSYTAVVGNIDQNYKVDAELHQQHALNQEIMNENYYNLFQKLFMSDPCQTFNDQSISTFQECEIFANASVQQGMAVAVARYFENLRYLITIYDLFWDHPEVDFDEAARGWGTFRNITNNSDNVTNYIYNLNNFQQAVQAREMQAIYIKGGFHYLQTKMIDGLNDEFKTTKTQLLAIFIVFEVLIFLFYFLIWLPTQMKIIQDLLRTRRLIMMIPLKVIQRIKSIKEYVSSLK